MEFGEVKIKIYIVVSGRMGNVKGMVSILGLMGIGMKVNGKTHLRMDKEQTF
jgi:hypothetical protein